MKQYSYKIEGYVSVEAENENAAAELADEMIVDMSADEFSLTLEDVCGEDEVLELTENS